MTKKEIFNSIDSLSSFSDFMPENEKRQFIYQLNKIKEQINSHLSGFFYSGDESSADRTDLLNLSSSQTHSLRKQDERHVFSNYLQSEKSLCNITSSLLAKITDKGKSKIEDISTPLKTYRLLKIVDEKLSIFELYNLYSYYFDNYLDFLSEVLILDEKKYIDIIRADNVKNHEGWVKIGEILTECSVIDSIKVDKAIEYKKKNNVFTGEAMVKLGFISPQLVESTLKIQSWISEKVKKSLFIGNIINRDKNLAHKLPEENALNILNFIIPVLNDYSKSSSHLKSDRNSALIFEIVDGNSSLIKIYEKNKGKFKNSRLDFFKFILTLDSQGMLSYRKNDEVEKRDTWVRFGALLEALELVSQEQIDETFDYRHRHINRQMFIGEALVTLKHLTMDKKLDALKIQRWCNMVLTQISYETTFITAVNEVLRDFFNYSMEIGSFTKLSLDKPLENMLSIVFNITGKLNGKIFYIFDRSFFEDLTKTLMELAGMSKTPGIDESVVTEVCNIITGSSLTKLSQNGVFCETGIPQMITGNERIIEDNYPISLLPLMNNHGRFFIGFQFKK